MPGENILPQEALYGSEAEPLQQFAHVRIIQRRFVRGRLAIHIYIAFPVLRGNEHLRTSAAAAFATHSLKVIGRYLAVLKPP